MHGATRANDTDWPVRLSLMEAVTKRSRCPKSIAQARRQALIERYPGNLKRVVRSISCDNGNWSVNTDSAVGTLGRPSYVALSYRWDASEPVSVAGCDWPVLRWNLDKLLHVFQNLTCVTAACRAGPVYQRFLDEEIGPTDASDEQWDNIGVWCDALCVDQRPGSDEKANQVAAMGKIYRQAECVVVVCKKVSHFPSATEVFSHSFVQSYDVYSDQPVLLRHTHEAFADDRGQQYVIRMWDWLKQLASEDWWARVWTLQEACCARKLLFLATDGSVMDAGTLFVLTSVVRELLNTLVITEAEFDNYDAVNKMVSQFLIIGHLILTIQYCPLLPAADVWTLTRHRQSDLPEDHVYGLLGLTDAQITVQYNVDPVSVQDRFNRQCIASGDYSVLFGFGARIDRYSWQTRVGEDGNRNKFPYVFFRRPWTVEQREHSTQPLVQIELLNEGASNIGVAEVLQLTLQGGYCAAPLTCLYIEEDSVRYLNTSARILRIFEQCYILNMDAWDWYRIFDDQDSVTMTLVLIWISMMADEQLGQDYVRHLFYKMMSAIDDHLDSLPHGFKNDVWPILQSPELGTRKGAQWQQGREILKIMDRYTALSQLRSSTMEWARVIIKQAAMHDDGSMCRLALALLREQSSSDGDNQASTPVCLLLAASQTSLLHTVGYSSKQNMSRAWAIPTGLCTDEKPMCLVGVSEVGDSGTPNSLLVRSVGLVLPRSNLRSKIHIGGGVVTVQLR